MPSLEQLSHMSRECREAGNLYTKFIPRDPSLVSRAFIHQGVEVISLAPSVFDPAAEAKLMLKNVSTKLARITELDGRVHFLEPGEQVTVSSGHGGCLTVDLLNNGV